MEIFRAKHNVLGFVCRNNEPTLAKFVTFHCNFGRKYYADHNFRAILLCARSAILHMIVRGGRGEAVGKRPECSPHTPPPPYYGVRRPGWSAEGANPESLKSPPPATLTEKKLASP